MARKKSTFYRSLGGGTIVSSQPSAGQSALVDSIPVIGAETQHPCLTRPPDCFCSVSFTCTMFPANWIEAPQGAYSQICELLWSTPRVVWGNKFHRYLRSVSRSPPIARPGPHEEPGLPGPPRHPGRAAHARTAPYKSESVVVATRRNQTSRQGYPHARLCDSWLPGGEEAPRLM